MIFDFLLDEVYLAEPSGSEKGIRSSKKIEKGLKAEVKKTPRLGFEPRQRDPNSLVLPLHHLGIKFRAILLLVLPLIFYHRRQVRFFRARL